MAETPERCTREKSIPGLWYLFRVKLAMERLSHSTMYALGGRGTFTSRKNSGHESAASTALTCARMDARSQGVARPWNWSRSRELSFARRE